MKPAALLLPLCLAACTTAPVKAPPVPPPTIIEVPVKVYVPIDAKLRARCAWKRDVLPSQSMAAARERGNCAEQYERQLDAIGKVQGQPVPAVADTSTQVSP